MVSALSHIDTNHPREFGPDFHKNQKIAKACLSQMCDPSLIFQWVAILDKETRKKHLKSHERNIYENAAELLSNMVDVKWREVDRRGGIEFTCKLCGGFSKKINNARWEKECRTRLVKHLTKNHPSNCQSLASQLEVPLGKKLNAMLLEAMTPELHDVWGKMIKLHDE